MTKRTVVGVLGVQGDVREHLDMVRGLGADAMPVRRPEELDGIDGLVIPGGESTTMDKLVRAFGLYAPLRGRIAAGFPVYGSCAGMIMLADRILDGHREQQTLGGLDVTVRRNAFGRQVDSFEADIRIEGLSDPDTPFRAVFIRAPWAEELGPRAHPLGVVAGGPAAGRVVAIRQGNLLATSFHPEMTEDPRVHEYFLGMVTAARREPAES